MKKIISLIVFLFVLTSLSFAYSNKEIYRKINSYDFRYLYLYESYENDEIIFYELKTQETKKGVRTEYRIRSYDVEKLKKFVVYLQKNYDECTYSEAITKYSMINEDLIYLWDNVNLNTNLVTEEYCYQLK